MSPIHLVETPKRMLGRLALAAFVPLALMAGSAETPAPKPPCRAEIQGRFWPEAANSDRNLMRKLAQSGDLEMCAVQVWKYRWKPVSVNAAREAQKRTQKVHNDGSRDTAN